ncbi:Antigen MPT64 [Mycobacterium basiliense]|uniref:Antigen MPT64 n=1 Tax=Mycobacterium basiliense TaxID=2094119 RepID=A0A3S4DU02_9MYCO|nr:esterase [Mycobacterium basiliense]VDM89155.1 Antigen MPT64 [Mycobacterium basiliense]
MRNTMFVLITMAVLVGSTGVAAAAPKSYCDELKGVTTGQVCQIQVSDPAYTIDISLPSNYPDPKSPLQSFVNETRDDFLGVAKSSTPRDTPYALDITSTNFESAIPPRGTQSVVLKIYQNVGGAHPATTYKAFNWDQGYRKPITYETLWQPDTDPLKVVFPIVQSALTKQAGTDVPIVASAGLDPTNYQNFTITNDGVIFFFGQGELVPDAVGATQVLVPRAAIDSMLA